MVRKGKVLIKTTEMNQTLAFELFKPRAQAAPGVDLWTAHRIKVSKYPTERTLTRVYSKIMIASQSLTKLYFVLSFDKKDWGS